MTDVTDDIDIDMALGIRHVETSIPSPAPRNPANKPDCYWVGMLASGMGHIMDAETLAEAKEIAGGDLKLLLDPMEGMRGIPETQRLRWRIAIQREKP